MPMNPFNKKKRGSKAMEAFEVFLDKIPLEKLQMPIATSKRTIYEDGNYRLDLQSMTPEGWNLQVQANILAPEKAVALLSPNTASTVIVPKGEDEMWEPAQIIAKFRENSIFNQPEGLDIERLSMRSGKSSTKSFQSLKDKTVSKARKIERKVKQAFRNDD